MSPNFGSSGARVSVRGMENVKNLVKELQDAGVQTTPVFRAIGMRMKNIQLDHFDERKQMDGSPWPPLSTATLQARRKAAGTTSEAEAWITDVFGQGDVEPLKDTGVMFGSITFQARKTFAVVGTNDPKGPFHQKGKGRPPKREFIFLRDDDLPPLINMLVDQTVRKPMERT